MKKVVLICLLSLALCHSQATSPDAKASPPAGEPMAKGSPNDVKKDPAIETKPVPTTTVKPTEKTVPPASIDNKTPTGVTPLNGTTIQNGTEHPVTTEKATEPTTQKTDKPAGNATIPITTEKPTEKTNASTVTTAKPTPEPTVEPSKAQPPKEQARKFDGASFFGGIVLTLGLLAIGFMGFKYYKNQTERNYHTL